MHFFSAKKFAIHRHDVKQSTTRIWQRSELHTETRQMYRSASPASASHQLSCSSHPGARFWRCCPHHQTTAARHMDIILLPEVATSVRSRIA